MGRFKPVLVAALAMGCFAPPAAPAQDAANPGNPVERFAGVYQLSGKQMIYIQPWPGSEAPLSYLDETGQFRALFASAQSPGESTFTAGPGLLVREPVELAVTFIEDAKGKVKGLLRKQSSGRRRSARKLDSYQREEVSFRSGGERLTGVLLTPAGRGAHPALVLIGGTGAAERNSVLPIAQFLLAHGVALLGYDQRGVGGSTGDWRTASLQDFAQDTIAAVRLLKGRREIDSKRIGVFGASQGGWVAPLAAAQSRDIAFVISVSGPGVSPAEVELDRLENDLRARGFPAAEIREAVDLMNLRYEVTRGVKPVETLLAAVEKAADAPWLPYAPVPRTADSWLLAHWRNLPLDYDPATALGKLRVPVLALFGALDRNVLEPKNADRWRAALGKGGAQDYTLRIFPTANHMLLEARTGAEEEYATLQHFVPEYEPTLLRWLQQRKFAAR